MNRRNWTCGAGIVAMWLAGAVWAGELSQWRQVAEIAVPAKPTKGLVEVALTPETLATARADLGDLRMVGPVGETTPYVTRVDRNEPGQLASYKPLRKYNAVFIPYKQSSVVVDFGNKAVRTRVDVDTPGANFRRRAMVEASADGDHWQVLVPTAWLFQIAYDAGVYSKSEITLPENDFRYLRITVFNAPDDPEQVPIHSVMAWRIKAAKPKLAAAPARGMTITENGKLKATEIEADLGYENLSLAEVGLSLGSGYFVRRVEIMGRNARTRTIVEPVENGQPRKREVEEPWNRLGGGMVYRLPGEEGQEAQTGLKLSVEGQCRYVLIRIFNGDNAPLIFGGLEAWRFQAYVAFQAAQAGVYRLYMGNPEATRPQYDLEHYAARLRGEGLTEATLGVVRENPAYAIVTRAVPWSDRYAWLLWTLLLAATAAVGGLVWRQARQASAVGQAGGGELKE